MEKNSVQFKDLIVMLKQNLIINIRIVFQIDVHVSIYDIKFILDSIHAGFEEKIPFWAETIRNGISCNCTTKHNTC